MTKPSYYMRHPKYARFSFPKEAALCLAALFLIFFLSTVGTSPKASAKIQMPNLLRFHVLANSNRPEDQALKMEVREVLLSAINDGIRAEVSSGTPLTKEKLQVYITNHQQELEETAETCMASFGFSYPAEIRIEPYYFPEKEYGGVTFPCGTYDAVRVLLGEGKGKNWWCVLYPPLSFSGSSACSVTPADESVTERGGVTVQVKSRFAEFFTSLLPPTPDSAR